MNRQGAQVDSGVMSTWDIATLAAALIAVDPAGVGGISLRARAGPVRDRWLQAFAAALPKDSPQRRVPLQIADGRLLGGLDLAATLKHGRPVAERGLLAEADGGVIVLASAERIEAATVARITAVLDQGHVEVARDGFASSTPSRFGVVALDEGIADDECPSAALLDRLAFQIDLDGIGISDAAPPVVDAMKVLAARDTLGSVVVSDEILAALCSAAHAMGIGSFRAPLLAVNVARAAAALDGRNQVTDDDARLAAQMVLAPRATIIPAQDQADEAPPQEPEPPPPEPQNDNDDPGKDSQIDDQVLADMVLEAAQAAIPAGLLAALKAGTARRNKARSSGRAGVKQRAVRHGRPVGVERGELKQGARLNIVETLRAAAVWQPLRRREAEARGISAAVRRVEVRKDDFRITRYKKSTETTTIFVVDASGSAALHRLAEAKGAVELLLADCYVRRDHVALIAFRGKTAELMLPPTRSLVRAKRSLAGLPGGGGTPIALALDAAAELSDTVRRKGQTPTVIVLTDGRANIARDGSPGRPRAEEDAIAAAGKLALSGTSAVVIDTSAHPAQQSQRLADAMAAVYLPLPYADAAVLSKAIKATAGSAA
jgi:magnesium chelatase subunit D